MGLTLIPAILIVAGGTLIAWGLRRRGALGRLPQNWSRVVGTVIDTGNGRTTPPRIEYRAPDGRRLRILGPLATPLTVGEEITVLIDPADATRARLDLTENEAARVVRLLIGTGAVLLVLGAVTAIAFL